MQTKQSQEGNVIVTGTIPEIRKLEDALRATESYDEYLFSDRHNHPTGLENEEGIAFTKKYALTINQNPLGFDTKLSDLKLAMAVKFSFWYDYRNNTANLKLSGDGYRLAIQTFPNLDLAFNGYHTVPVIRQETTIERF